MTSNIYSHHIGQSSGHERCIYCNAKWESGLRVRVMNDLNNFTAWCEYCKHNTYKHVLHLNSWYNNRKVWTRNTGAKIHNHFMCNSVCCYIWYLLLMLIFLPRHHCTALTTSHCTRSERLCCGHLPNSCGGVAKAACRLPLRGSQCSGNWLI